MHFGKDPREWKTAVSANTTGVNLCWSIQKKDADLPGKSVCHPAACCHDSNRSKEEADEGESIPHRLFRSRRPKDEKAELTTASRPTQPYFS